MGNSEETKPARSDKPASPAPPDQMNVHVYPDWAAMQAYYGPRVAIPPYYNSAMASGHHHPPPPPPYMWGPQHMMSPYGAPYAALYSHGGVYAHPGVPMGTQPQGQKVPPSTTAGTPLSIDMPTKSTGNTDNGLMKKLKEFDGIAMSIGNGHAECAGGGAEHKQSQSSLDSEGSTDGSDGNTTEADQSKKKSRLEGTRTKDGKHLTQSGLLPSAGKPVTGTVLSPGVSAKSSPCPSQTLSMVPSEAWLQNERELKRERRKQSNRESARRSRLRKQAETEELGRKVDALTAENMSLRSEINQLAEKSESLRVENAALLEKLKNSGSGHTAEICSKNNETHRGTGVNTENLLSRVNDNYSGSVEMKPGDKDSNSKGKLRQLLDTSPRADAVAAG